MRWLRLALVGGLLITWLVIASPAQARRAQVYIDGGTGAGSFTPAGGSISTGDTVVWTNRSGTTHTVTGDEFSSGNIAPGGEVEHTFNNPGTFSYHCSIHSSMTGTLQITGDPVSSPPPPPPPPPPPAASATTRTTARGATTTVAKSSGETTTTVGFQALAPTTTEETTTTAVTLPIKEKTKGSGNGAAIAALVVALAAVVGGGGFALYRLGARRAAAATPKKK